MRRLLLIAATSMVISSPALAWHEAGHKATAAKAFEHMEPEMRRHVAEILRAHPRYDEDFAALMPEAISNGTNEVQGKWLLEQASIWPDLIQTLGDDVRREYNRSMWHYINMLVWLMPDDEAALEGKLDHNMSTRYESPLRQNLNMIQALRGNLEVWHDQTSSDADRAVALCWIVHLVGDLHQPLHNVALFSVAYFPKGDRGGNSIKVQWGDETRNLHAVWDGLPTNMDDLRPTPRTVRSIEEDVVDDAAIDEWMHHHANLARKFVYTQDVRNQLLERLVNNEPPVIELSREYLIAARTIARRQINLTGHRIPKLVRN